MNDQELLELAAKAAKLQIYWGFDGVPCCHDYSADPDKAIQWNPLEDGDDALRLAGRVGLMVDAWHERAIHSISHGLGKRDWIYASDDGSYAGPDATRRAIVRAAAEIGKGMP